MPEYVLYFDALTLIGLTRALIGPPSPHWAFCLAASGNEPLLTVTLKCELDLHAERGLESDFSWKFVRPILGLACFVGLFSLKSCCACDCDDLDDED